MQGNDLEKTLQYWSRGYLDQWNVWKELAGNQNVARKVEYLNFRYIIGCYFIR
jgi:hypothetical protein